ncbi:MAG: GNAT family N-acetyltransferase [Gaiella sp.]
MGSLRVLSLGDGDVGVAGRVIARAFETDDLNLRQYPEAETRARCAPMLFEALVRYDLLYGQVDYVDGFVAVASWMRPGEIETAEKLARAGFEDLPEDVDIPFIEKVFGFVGPAIAEVQSDPHWHLRLLAVDPERQGGGIGALLMRHGLDRAAASGHAVVLETFSPRAMQFYARNGFETIVDAIEPTSGLRFWALRHGA